jgi:hypothetical protein
MQSKKKSLIKHNNSGKKSNWNSGNEKSKISDKNSARSLASWMKLVKNRLSGLGNKVDELEHSDKERIIRNCKCSM